MTGQERAGVSIATRASIVCGIAVLALLGDPTSASAQTTCEGVGVRARVQDQTTDDEGAGVREPVPGIEIVVADASGEEVGRGTTGEDGQALICLEGPAVYTVTLDEDTLPDDFELAGEGEFALDEGSFLTSIRQLNFFTGESSRESLSFFEKLAQRTVDGIRLGLILAITSVGLSLIFGTTGLTNFAHGEMVTFGRRRPLRASIAHRYFPKRHCCWRRSISNSWATRRLTRTRPPSRSSTIFPDSSMKSCSCCPGPGRCSS